jgi:hypothetical protein
MQKENGPGLFNFKPEHVSFTRTTRKAPSPQRLAHLEASANAIRGLLKKARLAMLGKANVEGAMKTNTLQDLLKSTLARAEWMRRKG